MRLVVALIGASMGLAGCSGSQTKAPTSISLLFPADQASQAAAKANEQCQFYGKRAKLHGSDARGITYDCE